jgi:hypothetical protein
MTEVADPAELAVTDGMTPPANLPHGEIGITLLPSGRLRIDHADPRILISAGLLDSIVDARAPDAWLDLSGRTTYDGALLKISGVNRTVIYRIEYYVPRLRGYIAEWPD